MTEFWSFSTPSKKVPFSEPENTIDLTSSPLGCQRADLKNDNLFFKKSLFDQKFFFENEFLRQILTFWSDTPRETVSKSVRKMCAKWFLTKIDDDFSLKNDFLQTGGLKKTHLNDLFWSKPPKPLKKPFSTILSVFSVHNFRTLFSRLLLRLWSKTSQTWVGRFDFLTFFDFLDLPERQNRSDTV